MKQTVKLCLLAVLLAVLLAACSTSRKVASKDASQQFTASVATDKHTLSQTNDAAAVRTTETDLSSAIIEFTKVEYTDGTEEVKKNANAASVDTAKQRDRKQTKPPNATQKVKSVTSGRIILNNGKTKQTDTKIEHTEAMQADEFVKSDVDADIETSEKTEDKPKHGFFYYSGIIATVICVLFAGGCIAYGIWRLRKQLKK